MDEKSVNYAEPRFNEIKDEVSKFLTKVGYKGETIPFIPISGWNGDNLIERSDKMKWYKGPILLEALDAIVPPKRPNDLPLRLPLQDVYKVIEYAHKHSAALSSSHICPFCDPSDPLPFMFSLCRSEVSARCPSGVWRPVC